MKLASLVKMARGGMGPDEIKAMLAAAGVEVSFTPVPAGSVAFRELAAAAARPGAKLTQLVGRTKGGDTLTALLIVNQS